jgi:hypothetical protein
MDGPRDELLADTRLPFDQHRGIDARHIANLYAKIGVRSRAEATAYAFRHDLH